MIRETIWGQRAQERQEDQGKGEVEADMGVDHQTGETAIVAHEGRDPADSDHQQAGAQCTHGEIGRGYPLGDGTISRGSQQRRQGRPRGRRR